MRLYMKMLNVAILMAVFAALLPLVVPFPEETPASPPYLPLWSTLIFIGLCIIVSLAFYSMIASRSFRLPWERAYKEPEPEKPILRYYSDVFGRAYPMSSFADFWERVEA